MDRTTAALMIAGVSGVILAMVVWALGLSGPFAMCLPVIGAGLILLAEIRRDG